MALPGYRGAIIVGDPNMLASTLLKISGGIDRSSDNNLRHAEGASAFFIRTCIAQFILSRA